MWASDGCPRDPARTHPLKLAQIIPTSLHPPAPKPIVASYDKLSLGSQRMTLPGNLQGEVMFARLSPRQSMLSDSKRSDVFAHLAPRKVFSNGPGNSTLSEQGLKPRQLTQEIELRAVKPKIGCPQWPIRTRKIGAGLKPRETPEEAVLPTTEGQEVTCFRGLNRGSIGHGRGRGLRRCRDRGFGRRTDQRYRCTHPRLGRSDGPLGPDPPGPKRNGFALQILALVMIRRALSPAAPRPVHASPVASVTAEVCAKGVGSRVAGATWVRHQKSHFLILGCGSNFSPNFGLRNFEVTIPKSRAMSSSVRGDTSAILIDYQTSSRDLADSSRAREV
jgi:hypothetical protein